MTGHGERLRVLRALQLCLDNTVEVMSVVAQSTDDDSAVAALKVRFGFDDLQARAVLAMQIRRFSATENAQLKREIAELEAALK
ncbi:hypothetical protein HQ325_16780 [Rhodococcus sp. BP-349]|nr:MULTISPECIES: DNA gyrase subunit A [unclassified Rhodococcus (in: high G+C Gram-positive bacteria)]MBY6597141.1 hypothetical protein [Rhodococcus sp. BP-359]MBY6623167.1 hypothetical protein [Rhodococcus sp. BP-357]MBY6540331.1 hypothetical protein [Rhodococcus sp. BP-363]MBY6545644.1 hypothetical protein [Rhodococcus sp. BP-369]MBY6564874.1 hypothetical protein [Rhodococcus sp. BP-370]